MDIQLSLWNAFIQCYWWCFLPLTVSRKSLFIMILCITILILHLNLFVVWRTHSLGMAMTYNILHKIIDHKYIHHNNINTQIVKFMGPTWGPPGTCRLQMGPMLAPWTLLSGYHCWSLPYLYLLKTTLFVYLMIKISYLYCNAVSQFENDFVQH